MPYTIQSAQKSDLSMIAALEQECFDDPWSFDMLQQDNTNHWSYFRVLKKTEQKSQKEEIIGLCIYWHVIDELHLIQVAVHPEQRRKGWGRRLMADLFAQGREKQAVKIFLEVRRSNHPAIKLYRSLAFEQIGIRKNYYHDPPEDAIVMEFVFSAGK